MPVPSSRAVRSAPATPYSPVALPPGALMSNTPTCVHYSFPVVPRAQLRMGKHVESNDIRRYEQYYQENQANRLHQVYLHARIRSMRDFASSAVPATLVALRDAGTLFAKVCRVASTAHPRTAANSAPAPVSIAIAADLPPPDMHAFSSSSPAHFPFGFIPAAHPVLGGYAGVGVQTGGKLGTPWLDVKLQAEVDPDSPLPESGGSMVHEPPVFPGSMIMSQD